MNQICRPFDVEPNLEMCHVGNHRIIAGPSGRGAHPGPPRCNAKKSHQGIGLWCPRGLEFGFSSGEVQRELTAERSRDSKQLWRVQGQRISIFWEISFQHLSESGWQHSDCQIAEESSRDAKLSDCWMTGIYHLHPVSWCGKRFSGKKLVAVYIFVWTQLWRGFVSFMVAWRCILPRDWHESCLCPPIMLKWSTRVSTGVTWFGTTLDPGWI